MKVNYTLCCVEVDFYLAGFVLCYWNHAKEYSVFLCVSHGYSISNHKTRTLAKTPNSSSSLAMDAQLVFWTSSQPNLLQSCYGEDEIIGTLPQAAGGKTGLHQIAVQSSSINAEYLRYINLINLGILHLQRIG